MKAIRRDKIQRDIEAGKMEAKCNQVLTDDYAYDNAANFQRSDWKRAAVLEYSKRQYSKADEQVCYFAPSDFHYSTGRAYWNLDGTIAFTPLCNHYYTLRYKSAS